MREDAAPALGVTGWRWCVAVNAHGGCGSWAYRVAEKPEEVRAVLDSVFRSA